MNILEIQDKLKGLSEEQLAQEMRAPSGATPQFLVLSELSRRKRMRDDLAAQEQKGDQATVAEEAIAAAGVPQAALPQMAAALAPKTSAAQNTGIAALAPQAMKDGGRVRRMAPGGIVVIGGRQYEADPATIAYADRLGLSVADYLASLPEDEASGILADAEARAERDRMMALEPVGMGVTFPSQRDLDQRYREQQYPQRLSRPEMAPEEAPPILPGADAPPNIAASLAMPAVDLDLAPQQSEYDDLMALAATEQGLSPESMAALEEAGPPSLSQRTARIMEELRAERAEPSLSQRTARIMEELRAERAVSMAAPAQGRTPRAAGLAGRTIAEQVAIDKAELDAKAANALVDLPPLKNPDGTPALPEIPTAPAAEAVVEDVAAPADPPPQGGAGGAGGMSAYEQELADAIARSEKRAEQDKWLAVAQMGLALMSSTKPTLGGAIGEAGTQGLAAYQRSRDAAEATRLQLAEAQYAVQMAKQNLASGGGMSAKQRFDMEIDLRNSLIDELEVWQTLAESAQTEKARMDANRQIQRIMGALSGQGGAPAQDPQNTLTVPPAS